MRTGKRRFVFLSAGILVASLHAAVAQQPKNITINQGNCNLTIINTGKGDQKVNIETGICADEVDPNKAIRIRYVWLNAVSASLLLAGKVDSDLARALGANPYVTKNKVFDELAGLIKRFGSDLAASGANEQALSVPHERQRVSTTLEGQGDSTFSEGGDFENFRRRTGNPKIYNAEEDTVLPEPDAYLTIQNTPAFPSNYSMYYSAPFLSSGDEPARVMSTVTLWRELTPEDLRNYGRDTATLRSLILQRKFKIALDKSLAPQNAKFWDERQNRTVSAMLYFARAGWPANFLFASGTTNICGSDVGATITMPARRLFVQVAVLDNVQGRGVLPISILKGEQIDTDRLRAADDDKNWAPVDLPFPAGVLRANESIIVPLQLQLRPAEVVGADVTPADSNETLKQIKSYPKPLVTKDEKGRAIYQKSKDAFKPPSFPVRVDYTYGPRLRLSSVVSGGKEIKLRQFNPLVVTMHFGFETGSCPGIYVQAPDAETPVSYGRILVGAVGAERARTDILWHDGPALFVELAEDEPEITRVRSIKVFAVDADGVERLAAAKTDQFVMPGLPLRIEAAELLSAARIRVEVEGYYKTLPSLLLQNATLDDMLE
jgi:hypothetical protein